MAIPNNKNAYELDDGYSVSLQNESVEHLKIELYRNGTLICHTSLNDNQCSAITHRLCDGKNEFHNLLIDILDGAAKSNVRVLNSKHLEISCTIRFGCQQTFAKVWVFKIQLEHAVSVDDISLDPQDWTAIRSLGHQIMDDMVDYLRDLRLRPTWQQIPLEIRKTIAQTGLPIHGQSASDVYNEVYSHVLPFPVGNIHPRFWGYVQGTGSVVGAFAELISGTMNTMSWGGHQSSIYIERQVLSWLKVLMGFPDDDTSSGVLVSGTSVATIIALAIARKKFSNRIMKVYCTKEAHSCIIRAMDLLNIGKENLILIPTNSERQIDLKVI